MNMLKRVMLAGIMGAMAETLAACDRSTPQEAEGPNINLAVETSSGKVAGLDEAGIAVFRGIPYAAAPVGDLRWKPPQKAAAWAGVRDAKTFGPGCVQLPPDPSGPPGIPGASLSEDCLFLNIWVPPHESSEKLPVMVHIHGGGLQSGGADFKGALSVDGDGMAKRGIVYVSIQYRLGVMGFMAHPQLTRESPEGVSGNYGLLDQIAALEWVRDNIAAFGGDPGRVTIFGGSGGATACLYLMTSPKAEGLFHGVISQSALGLVIPPRTVLKQAESIGAGMGPDVSALRAMPPEQILQKMAALPPALRDPIGFPFFPNVDGVVLPDQPALLFATGRVAKVPLIAGWASEDGGVGLAGVGPMSVEAWKGFAQAAMPAAPEKFLATFPAATDADVPRATARFFTDWGFAYDAYTSTRAVARAGGRAWLYEFSRANPRIWPAPPGVNRGAFHASDMAYAIGHYEGEVTAPDVYNEMDRAIGQAMTGAWVQFARTGDPNGPGLKEWRPVGSGVLERMEFGDHVGMGSPANAQALKVLDGILDGSSAPH
jgi:para-nitrobenzyl esterase